MIAALSDSAKRRVGVNLSTAAWCKGSLGTQRDIIQSKKPRATEMEFGVTAITSAGQVFSCSFHCSFFSPSSLLSPVGFLLLLCNWNVSLSSRNEYLKLYSLTLSVSSYVRTSEKLGEWNDKVTQSDLWVPSGCSAAPSCSLLHSPFVLLLVLTGIRGWLGAGGAAELCS